MSLSQSAFACGLRTGVLVTVRSRCATAASNRLAKNVPPSYSIERRLMESPRTTAGGFKRGSDEPSR
jgi:hypothetical protein